MIVLNSSLPGRGPLRPAGSARQAGSLRVGRPLIYIIVVPYPWRNLAGRGLTGKNVMTRFLSVLTVSTVAIVVSGFATDATAQTKFYDSGGGFRGYAFCRKPGMDIVDCNYYTLAQCQASGAGFGLAYCVPNPFTPGGGGKPRKRRQQAY